MPEGPEVKLVTEQLAALAENKTLTQLEILGGRYRDELPKGLFIFKRALPLKVIQICCKGKFIYWNLGSQVIFNTLGMTGSWSETASKHVVARLTLDGQHLFFNDIRHFGTLTFHSPAALYEKLNTLGPDMLSDPPDLSTFFTIFKKHKKTVTEAIMDQKVISGAGNYVKVESLYRAKLSPWRLCSSLSDTELEQLYNAILNVVNEAYAAGGTTLATFQDVTGKQGTYAEKLLVYGKKLDPNGLMIKSEETPDKRTTHWVPEVQV